MEAETNISGIKRRSIFKVALRDALSSSAESTIPIGPLSALHRMGAGRGALTFNLYQDDKHFRHLRKQNLGGVIFGCTDSTIKECLSKQLFGLRAPHMSYVSKIDPGLPLFLFNHTDRKLHGIFESASSGEKNIDPYGWTVDGSRRTPYPAQVQTCLRLKCQPLHEDQFKEIITDNYYTEDHFWFELDHAQTDKLMFLMSSLASSPSTSLSQNVARWRNVCKNIPLAHKGEGNQENEANSAVDFHQLDESNKNMPSASLDVVTAYSITGQSSGLQLNKRTMPEDKDCILLKLKAIALARQHSGSSLKKSVEHTAIVNDVSMEQSSIPEGQEISREKLEEQETFKAKKLWRTEYAEQKLVETEQQYVTLERRPTPCIEHVKEGLVEFSTEPHLNIEEFILLVGGNNGKTHLPSLDAYLPSKNKRRSLTPMSVARSAASVAMLYGELYAFGGGIGSEWYNTVESYSPTDNKWIPRPSLNGQPRGSLAGATLKNKIFAIGGGNESEFFSEVEMLDLYLGHWTMTRSMLEKRFALAAAELNGAIYAVGGCDRKDCLKSAERFDPRERSWTRIQSMSTRRSCPALTVSNEKLYVIGGFDGKNMVSSVEIYDPRNGSWMTGPAMNIPRGYSAAAVVKESIYVIGGVIDKVTIADMVERYTEDSGWEVIHQGSIACRCFASAIVL